MIDLTSQFSFRLDNLNQQQQKISYQMSTGDVIDKGSEDTIIYTKELFVEDKLRVYEGVNTQIDRSIGINEITDTNLGDAKEVLDSIKVEIMKGLNVSTAPDVKANAIVSAIDGYKSNLLLLMNESIDGQYVFAGSDATVRPFSLDETTGKVTYNGDGFLREVAVDLNTYRERGSTGLDAMFRKVSTGIGTDTLSVEVGERIVDGSGAEWKMNSQVSPASFRFYDDDTITDDLGNTWTIDTVNMTITDGTNTLDIKRANEGYAIKDTLAATNAGVTTFGVSDVEFRQFDINGDLTGRNLGATLDTSVTPNVYTTAQVSDTSNYKAGVDHIIGTQLTVKHNIFDDINDVIDALKNLDDDALRAKLDTITDAYDAANNAHGESGGRSKVFEDAKVRIESKITHYQIIQIETSKVDLAKVYMESSALEQTYTSLYTTISKLNNLSLLNFLN